MVAVHRHRVSLRDDHAGGEGGVPHVTVNGHGFYATDCGFAHATCNNRSVAGPSTEPRDDAGGNDHPVDVLRRRGRAE